MSSDKKTIQNFVKNGESKIFQGSRNISDFLPEIFKTPTNKKFIESTLDNLFSSGSTETIDHYWGRIKGSNFNYIKDSYIGDNISSVRKNYQFAPGFSSDTDDDNVNASYVNIIENLTKLGYDTEDIDKLFRDYGYVLDLPINLDMFVNYTNYFWVEQEVPICEISPTSDNPIDIDNITYFSSYKTPILENGKSLEFVNGIRIKFTGDNVFSSSGDFVKDYVYIVEGVGSENINLILQKTDNDIVKFPRHNPYSVEIPSEWDVDDWNEYDYDYSSPLNIQKEYVVINRNSKDKNAWARKNQWVSIYALKEISNFNDIPLSTFTTPDFIAKRPIIEFKENLELYNSGTNFRFIIDHHVDDASVDDIEGTTFYNNNGKIIEGTYYDSENNVEKEGDYVLFTTSQNYGTVYKATYQDETNYENIELTPVYTVSDYEDGDKFFIKHSSNDEFIYNEIFWNGSEIVKGQQTSSRSDSPLFQLYDYEGNRLDSYDGSTFYGNEIFKYKTSESVIKDNETNLNVLTDSISPREYIFEFPIFTKRYNRNSINNVSYEIKGDFFYKNIYNDDNSLFSLWKPMKDLQFSTTTQTHVVKDTDDAGEDIIWNINPLTQVTNYLAYVNEQNNLNWIRIREDYFYNNNYDNETIVFRKNVEYNIKFISPYDEDIEFFDPFGRSIREGYVLTENGDFLVTEDEKKITLENTTEGIVNVIKNNFETRMTISDQYEYDKIIYKSTNDTFSGVILVDDPKPNYKVFRNGKLLTEDVDFTFENNTLTVNTDKKVGDVFEVEYITLDSTNDLKSVSPLFDYNPDNASITEANISRLLPHFHDQLQSIPGVTTSYGENEYHKIYKDHTNGGVIRQQVYSPMKHSILSMKEETEPLSAITQLSYDYSIFKQSFKRKVRQLWNSKSYETVQEIVDDTLQQINIGKDENFKYAESEMVYYDNPTEQIFEISDEDTSEFLLNSKLNKIGTKSTHVYVWLFHSVDGKYMWVPLQKNSDFVIEYNKIILLISPNIETSSSSPNAKLKVHVYSPENSSFVPPSSVKTGFTKPFDVRVYDDDGNLQCHDGSIHKLTNTEIFDMNSPDFDVVSAALYDLETRIHNNIRHENIIDIKYFLPRKILSEFDYEKLNQMLSIEFNNWKASFGNEEDILETPYDSANPFTWNYSSVGDGFVSYKSIYRYVFGTHRPHTHPWEMLGFNEKPAWWETNYDWEETNKRENLIYALKSGIITSPEEDPVVDPKYAIFNYDWDNDILVTTDGELNDPITANVVQSPSGYLTQKKFKFGDLMFKDEMEWYNSSDFIFSLVKSFMKMKPFRIHEIYWKIGDIFNIDVLPYRYEVFDDYYTRETNRTEKTHLYKPELNELTSVSIERAGSGYNFENAYAIAPMNSKNVQAEIDFDLETGEFSDVVITDSSYGYRNNFSFIINDTTDTAIITGKVSSTIKRPVFGINLAVKEYNDYDIKQLLNNSVVSPILHLGGFSKKDLIDIYMDNSYRKNNISIPKDDFDVVLNKNPFKNNVYYSGIKFEKTQKGYIKVSGFNPRDKNFYIYPVNQNAKSFNEPIDNNFSVIRYANHHNRIETVSYNTVFKRNQELYNFLLGLQRYYDSVGFSSIEWKSKASEIIEWSIHGDIGSVRYENGLKNNTIVYEQGIFGFVDEFSNNTRINKYIVDKDNHVVDLKNLLVLRNETDTEVTTKNDKNVIYGIEFSVVSYEHLVKIKRQTRFGDIIYDTLFGIPRNRIKIYGERTRNWNGKLSSNGYIVSDDSILKNFDTSAREIETDILSSRNKSIDKLSRQTNKFTVGYQDSDFFSDNLKYDDITSYEFAKGSRKYKGTNIGIKSFIDNNSLLDSFKSYDLSEEWMIKLNEFGDLSNKKIEIELPRYFTSSNPQIIRFDNTIANNIYDNIIDISEKDRYYVSGDFENLIPMLPVKNVTLNSYDQSKLFENHLKNSGIPRIDDVDYVIKNVSDIEGVYDSNADYANVQEWSSNISYSQGDIVRYGPSVYKLLINSTGYDFSSLESTVRGNITFPEVPSGSELNFTIKLPNNENEEDKTITFDKTDPSTIIEELDIIGTISEPTLNSGDKLELNVITKSGEPAQNYVIDFQKEETQIEYKNIQVVGENENPQFSGSEDDFLAIDGSTIDMSNIQTTISKKTALDVWTEAFNKGSITKSESQFISQERINIIKKLCENYIDENISEEEPGLLWENFISSYFSGIYETSGINIDFLVNEFESLDGGELYEDSLKDLINHDIRILNGINSTSYEYDFDNNTFSPQDIPQSDIDNAVGLIEETLYLGDINEIIKSSDDLITSFDSSTTIVNNPINEEKSYSIFTAVSKINSFFVSSGKQNIVASVVDNKIAITKLNISEDDATLTIEPSPLNSVIGFPESGNTYEAEQEEVLTSGSFDLDEIVSVINSEDIPNITANVYTESSRRYLRIRNNNKELFIVSTPAVQKLGIGSGLYVSDETTQVIEGTLGINEIINQINSENIEGVTALNVNNSVVLNINAETFSITQGSANEFIGFQEGEISSTTVIQNTFNEDEWQKIEDPLYFSVWVQNNLDTFIPNNITQNSGYNVYQVFDFEYEIDEICAGEFEGDDALVKFFIPHNYSAGDYIVINGSNTSPQVDGIHRVTKIVDDFSLMIEEYIEQEGSGGKVFSLLPTRFLTTDELLDVKNNKKYFNNGVGWKTGMYAYVDSYENEGIPAVYRCATDIISNEPYFDLIRKREKTTDNSKIVNAIVYDYKTGEITKELEVFDPVKNIFPGIAEKEIDIKSSYDFAIYTNSTDPEEQVAYDNYWANDKTGIVWWDLSNAIYLDYEQSTLQYRQQNWGKLYNTSSIDIYEWTKSPVPPDEYEDSVSQGAVIDGVVLSGTPYYSVDQFQNIQYYWTEETKFNRENGISETYYYFWVKNKTTVPNNNRNYSTSILSKMIRDPSDFGIVWIAAISENSFLISNIEECLSCENAVLQINFDRNDSLTHREYLLLSENDNDTIIPYFLHKTLRESISQYAPKRYIMDYKIWDKDFEYNSGDVVKYDGKYYITYSKSINEEPLPPVYEEGNNSTKIYNNKWYELSVFDDTQADFLDFKANGYAWDGGDDWDSTSWDKPFVFDLDNLEGKIEIISSNRIPDNYIHPSVRYDIKTYENKSMIKNINDARREFISIINKILKSINLDKEFINWKDIIEKDIVIDNYVYNLTDFYVYENWATDSFNPNKSIIKTINSLDELQIINSSLGDYVKVMDFYDDDDGTPKYKIYEKTQSGWILVYQRNATIRFTDDLWNKNDSEYSWDVDLWDVGIWDNDTGIYIEYLFDICRNYFFSNRKYRSKYNEIWFGMLNYIHSEQDFIDWAFKSTNIKLSIDKDIDDNTNTYKQDNISNILDYINENKPYTTKLRDISENNNIKDDFFANVNDSNKKEINVKYNRVDDAIWQGDIVLKGGDDWDISEENNDYSLFDTTEFDYVYDADVFDNDYDYIEEKANITLKESSYIEITRNTSDNIENSDTIRYIIHNNNYYDTITDDKIVELSAPISSTDTEITVTNSDAMLFDEDNTLSLPYGIAWINGEKILYKNIQGNKLYNCIRGVDNTLPKNHDSGTKIYNGSYGKNYYSSASFPVIL